jgi:hypothetical protein
MTLGEFRTEVSTRLGDPAGVRYSSSTVADAINAGQELFALLTLAIERTGELPLEQGKNFYLLLDFFADFLVPLRVQLDSLTNAGLWDGPLWDEQLWDEALAAQAATRTRLRPAALAHLDARNQSWQNATGTPDRYNVLGFELLALSHQPTAANKRLRFTYAASPIRLLSDSDVPEIPAPYHELLADYAIATLRLDSGGVDMAKEKERLDRFYEGAARMAEFMRRRHKELAYDREPFELARYREEAAKKK